MKNILIIISQHNRSEHKYYTCKMDIIRRRGGGGLHCGKTTYITVSTYHGISQTSHVYADHPTRHASPMCTHDNYSTPCYINSSVEITAARSRWSAARRNAIFKDSATRERCRRYTFWCALDTALDVVIGLDRSYSCRTTRLNYKINLVGQNFLWSSSNHVRRTVFRCR